MSTLIQRTLLFIFLICVSLNAFPQETDKDIFLEAESYFLFEEYNEAIGLYLQLLGKYPDNANLQYKTGVCYLNNPFTRSKSISYLEDASENFSYDYKINSFKETSAPPEVLFELGNAYRVNNQPDKAIDAYTRFLKILDDEVFDRKIVQDCIDACKRYKSRSLNNFFAQKSNPGDLINDRFDQINPIVSNDGNRLAFVSRLQFYDALFYAEKVNGEWKAPRNLMPELLIDDDAYPVSFSADGTRMYIYRKDNYNGNIYVAHLQKGVWTGLHPLDENINTKFWESHACESGDGNTLYFTSNRDGGFGGLDIYFSKRLPDSSWGVPVNAGNIINTSYNEDCPFVSADGKHLYFSSPGHDNIGGYDVFIADKGPKGWTNVRNMGKSINTAEDDLFFSIFRNGDEAVMSLTGPRSLGKHDIYFMDVFSDFNPRKFNINLSVKPETPGIEIPDNFTLRVENKDGSFSKSYIGSDIQKGEINNIPQGKYRISYEGAGIKSGEMPLNLALDAENSGINLAIPLVAVPLPLINEPIASKTPLTPLVKNDKAIEKDQGEEPSIHFLIDAEEITTEDSVFVLRLSSPAGNTVHISYEGDPLPGKKFTIQTGEGSNEIEIPLQPGKNIIRVRIPGKGKDIRRRYIVYRNVPKFGLDQSSIDSLDSLKNLALRRISETDTTIKANEAKGRPWVKSKNGIRIIAGIAIIILLILIGRRRKKEKVEKSDS